MSREATLAQIAAAKGKLSRVHIEGAVRAFQATYRTRDWETRAALLSDDVVFEDTVGVPPPAIGKAAAVEYFKTIIAYDWHVEMAPKQIIVMGDEAFVITSASWAEKDAELVQLHLIHNFKFDENGKISHVRIAYDEGCLLS